MAQKTALVLLADGCEELEAVTVIDLLRRGGVNVTTASLGSTTVTASRQTKLVADTALDSVLAHAFDMVVLPGGMPGSDYLADDPRVIELLKRTAAAGRFTCAICAAPKVLAKAGLLNAKRATSYPGVLDALEMPGVASTGKAVEVDGTVVTSRGPGTAIDFSLALVEALAGRDTRDKVEQSLVR